ncbi:MAG: ImmA/IrrE family metallo-endopeptidase [Planctomycetia bacterium]|nr:ImmA/IrrE family metallo-endopeptidase [Planctomycetia bacterium]
MIKLRRGFKAEANSHAVALRRELNLAAHAPICPWRVAEHLDIPVVQLSDVEKYEPEGVRYLRGKGRDLFSAVTIFVGRHGRKRIVFHNDGHVKARQAANLAHELAHAILCHAPTLPFVPDSILEAEAEWLGPTLLVPDAAALHILEQKMSNETATRVYGVSNRLLDMRLNLSGARVRIARRQNN